MSLVAGGARGGSHRVEGSKEEGLMIQKSLAEMESSRRRSLRKREEKSYVESPDLLFEEEVKAGRGLKTMNSVISNGDVEMESEDDDEPLDPLPLPKELPPDALQEHKALIRKLQTQLRNEEMSLVLLKKIRQSQVIADQIAAAAAAKASNVPNSHTSSRDSYSQHRGTPPPGSAKVGMGAGSHKTVSQTSRNTGHQSSHTPAQIKNLMPDLSQLKPVNVDPKSLPPGLPASLMNMINKSVAGGKVNEGRTDSPKQQKVDTETPQQKQAAAKLALRKQLEKTLLQIPPPKPPPPEMHFIPNPANTEFICLLGLEECVGKILHENKEITVQPIPFTCSQCSTDFTPTWKWDKGARGKDVK